MYQGLLVIDADAHKLENPLLLRDYLDANFRDRIGFVHDRQGHERVRILDTHPITGRPDFARLYPQPDGLGMGGFSNLHPETTLGAIFNSRRIEDMDREGIDLQVIFGTFNLTFGSIIDRDLAIALCRAYNNYIADDCAPWKSRLFPVGVLPLQDVTAAVEELCHCVETLGMVAVSLPPHLPVPHPEALDRFPEIRTAKPISHPDFDPIFKLATELDVTIALHGAPGSYLVGGLADHLETFVLSHIFVQRSQQQLALVRAIFDGLFDRFPTLRMGFMEGGCGWLPDLAHACHEHWEKRIQEFDPNHPYRPSVVEFAQLAFQERHHHPQRSLLKQISSLFDLLWQRDGAAQPDAPDRPNRSLSIAPSPRAAVEHAHLRDRDPLSYLSRGQIFVSFEADDPAPAYLPIALGSVGQKLACFSGDYGHWDGVLTGCVAQAARTAGGDRDYLLQLLSGNALALYGNRLRQRITYESAA